MNPNPKKTRIQSDLLEETCNNLLSDLIRVRNGIVSKLVFRNPKGVFTDRELQYMVDKLPTTMNQLTNIRELDPDRCFRFGDEFLPVLNEYHPKIIRAKEKPIPLEGAKRIFTNRITTSTNPTKSRIKSMKDL
jgi:hypothetical protein